MSRTKHHRSTGRTLALSRFWASFLALIAMADGAWGQPPAAADRQPGNSERQALDRAFAERIQPLLKKYCHSCHGAAKQAAKLDLSRYSSAALVAGSYPLWTTVLERLQAEEMPPEDAPSHPQPGERRAIVAWIKELHEFEAARNAGDPGRVLARRLSNAEYDYTIRDLTGVDIRPTREFPVDPANEAGFDNSGESLAMSPALLKKYLAAAQSIADHVVFLPQGFAFAPHPMVTDTDRDKYCVLRIVDFYRRHPVELADYFHAAWRLQHRAVLGEAEQSLEELAAESGLSPKYLSKIVSLLADSEIEAGPLAVLRAMWRELPSPDGKNNEPVLAGVQRMSELVARLRRELQSPIELVRAPGISKGSQPLVLWNNRQRALRRMHYSGDVATDLLKLQQTLQQVAPPYAPLLGFDNSDAQAVEQLRKSLVQFCAVFPDTFAVVQRGPYFDPSSSDQQRLLTAGFHLMQGFFRDDGPLCELVLDEPDRRQLDTLWNELNFVTAAAERQYKDFIFFERAEPPRFMQGAKFDFARSEDKDATSARKIGQLREAYLDKAIRNGAPDAAVQAIRSYFADISAEIRRREQIRAAAEGTHLSALVDFAQRAYRRPLQPAERDELLEFYRTLRRRDGLSHEDAIRDAIASILVSPHFCYRFDLAAPGRVRPLNDYELASRLSYFLWSSMPDEELLAHARAGDLRQREVLIEQAHRMLRDQRVRGLATEFLGNLLDFRRFQQHNSVDRQRFEAFTNELRQAMFEEPIRFFVDIAQHNRSLLELVEARYTFVNPVLAAHYGIPIPAGSAETWVRVEDAASHGRGGLLPMAVFLTQNSPGLRTSPVKRGYWVVRRLLGEHIPPPPPSVPELPKDEAELGELTLAQALARHRSDQSCAACHQRFDSIGLALEDYGPIGERRTRDLGGRLVENRATFPDGRQRQGLDGLRAYLDEQRRPDFLANFTSKLFSYALGRSLLPSDQPTLNQMQAQLAADDYNFGTLIESIVTSPQFLHQRGEDKP